MPGNNNSFSDDNNKRQENLDLPKVHTNTNGMSSNDENKDSSNGSMLNNSLNQSNIKEENKPIIEIPQAYYDKLDKEKQERLEEQRKIEEQKKEAEIALNDTGKFFTLVIFNAVILFGLLYLTVNKTTYAMLGIPVFIIILTIMHAIKNKEKSSYPVSVVVGGMLSAIVCFVFSMFHEQEVDLWTYYTIASAVVAFLGMIVSNLITKIISDFKNIRALQAIGYLLFFGLLVGIPFYLSKNYHEEFYKYVFYKQVEVVAETESEFVLKTLKQRYNTDFMCGIYASKNDEANKNLTVGGFRHQIDQYNRRLTERICLDSNGNETLVQSIAYNEGAVQYTVIDDYMDTLFFNEVKKQIKEEIGKATGKEQVELFLYPKENCTFYGDCADCDDYFARYEKENTDFANQFQVSSQLNFVKEMTEDKMSFINNHEFKFIMDITGNFGEVALDYSNLITTVLDKLNQMGYKNTFGYIITLTNLQNSSLGEIKTVVYKVEGKTNSEQVFKDPEKKDISGNH